MLRSITSLFEVRAKRARLVIKRQVFFIAKNPDPTLNTRRVMDTAEIT
jgi:hypothetical protein